MAEDRELRAWWVPDPRLPPRPAPPACPRCDSARTVSHHARAHCGGCGHEWQLEQEPTAPAVDADDPALADWAVGRPPH